MGKLRNTWDWPPQVPTEWMDWAVRDFNYQVEAFEADRRAMANWGMPITTHLTSADLHEEPSEIVPAESASP